MNTTPHTFRWALVGLVAVVALLGTVTAQVYEDLGGEQRKPARMHTVRVDSVDELHALFDQYYFTWPLHGSDLPSLSVAAFPPDYATIDDVEQKKSLFVRTMLPIVVNELERLTYQRKLVDFLWRPDALTQIEDYRAVVLSLAKQYQRNGAMRGNASERGELMWKLDSLPIALVLAQAALESGWGTSKYAMEANNLFGVYVPLANGGREIKRYDTLADSVRDYLSTVNNHPAYRDLRTMRAGMRIQNQELDTSLLAHGLVKYSERGHDYVDDVLRMLRGTTFQQIQRAEPKLQTAAI